LLPDFVPDYSVGPFIGLVVNGALALLCLLTYLCFPRYKPLSRLLWVYLAICSFFLGFTAYGLQRSESSILFWYRILLLGLTWLPFTWLSYITALREREAGPGTWATGLAAVVISGLLILVRHPAVLAPPLEPLVRAEVMRPQSYLIRPLIYFLVVSVGGASIGLIWRAWRGGESRPAWVGPIVAGLVLWLLGAINDVLYSLQLQPNLNLKVSWLASIWLSCCLTLALALHYRNMGKAVIRQAEELIHARNLAALGTVAAKVAHQVGGFLNKLVFALAIVKAENLSPDGVETINAIERSSLQLSQFTRRFLSFARRPELDFQPLSLNEALEAALDQCRDQIEAGRVQVTTVFDGKIQIVGDWSLLSQAFVNVIINALEALNGQGRLEVRLKRLGSGWIGIDFEDNGTGMDQATQAEAWEPFVSRKGQGIGLGLPVVRNIVEAHGGRVSLESRPGRGTLVSLSLPASRQGWSQEKGLGPNKRPGAWSGPRVPVASLSPGSFNRAP